jgi:putative transposase
MTVTKIRTDVSAVKQLLASDKEFLKPLIQTLCRRCWKRR